MSEAVFWLGLAVLGFIYLGYPALMVMAARLRPRPVVKSRTAASVSLVIVAHNEAAHLPRKLENLLALAPPRDAPEIVVASDGSTDGTVQEAERFAARGVRLIAFPVRRGKPAVLNDVIPRCRGEIVVLGDARQIYDEGALRALVDNFADPAVGAVSGELHLVRDTAGSGVGEGVGIYWRYEKLIRWSESRFDSSVGATGAIYAIRRALFEPMPVDTLVDDVLIPLRIARRGYRVVFEPDARAFDRMARTPREEFVRKVRTIAGTLQLFARERWIWNPLENRLWFQAVAHKFLRILGPFLLLGVLASSVMLATGVPLFGLVVLAQVAFYAFAVLGLLGTATGRWTSIPSAFCLLNAAAAVGVFRFVTGSQSVKWLKASEAEWA
jgi:cellulose synthase/poly-beta-1,6-N-acetylglucosamine synthase-like glycosyltransferase